MTDTKDKAMTPITMQDVRLIAGEGKLSAHDVLAAVNAHLRLHPTPPAPQAEGEIECNLSQDLFRATLIEAHHHFMATGVNRESDERWDDMAAVVWKLVEQHIVETENRIIDAEFAKTEAENNLAALRSAQAPAGWQSIETAPKDGAHILVIGGRFDRAEIVPSDGDWWRANPHALQSIPTHWMPLPSPPRALAPKPTTQT